MYMTKYIKYRHFQLITWLKKTSQYVAHWLKSKNSDTSFSLHKFVSFSKNDRSSSSSLILVAFLNQINN